MNKSDCFESERLCYRGITDQDADCLVRWRSTDQLIRYFKNPEPLTLQGHRAWFINSYLHNTFRYDYVIAEKASQTRIGTIGVSNLDYHKKSCVLSYMIAVKAYQRRGFAGEAIVAMMERVKREGIEVFIAEIHQDNIASLGTVEKLGFLQYSQEGNFLLFRYVR